ncbi:MAG TPA: lysozyme inhibitor LprI family protein [Allosphingosinicella sp.]|nr:lysozyme inhibitor LprI family protein [Allosphingosinicella sp.]
MRMALLLAGLAALAGCAGGTEENNAAAVNESVAAPTRVAGFDWGNPGGDLARDQRYARSQALCRVVAGRAPPAGDRPDAATTAALANCDAEALYYGIGVARDPARARLCAFTQQPSDQMLEPFAGRAMLMTVYANGQGAARDLALAIRLACTIEGAEPAEYDRRVTRLARLRDENWRGSDFSYCDDIDPGLGTGLCASHRAALARPQREAAQRALLARWSPEQRQAYEPLRRAFEEFVAASAEGDLARSGTSHRTLRNRLEQGLRDQFAEMLQRLEAGRAPRFTSGQLRTEDLQLNQAYQARIADERQYDAPGISPDSIQNAQRAWLRYRDAFLAFAAVKYPAVQRDSLAAWITQNRSQIIPGI